MSAYRGRQRGSPRREQEPRPRRGLEDIASLVARVVERAPIGGSGQLRALQQAWVLAVGRDYAQQAWVAGYRTGVLTVEASSAALAQELSVYHKARLLKRLAQDTGLPLKDLRCRLGELPAADPEA